MQTEQSLPDAGDREQTGTLSNEEKLRTELTANLQRLYAVSAASIALALRQPDTEHSVEQAEIDMRIVLSELRLLTDHHGYDEAYAVLHELHDRTKQLRTLMKRRFGFESLKLSQIKEADSNVGRRIQRIKDGTRVIHEAMEVHPDRPEPIVVQFPVMGPSGVGARTSEGVL